MKKELIMLTILLTSIFLIAFAQATDERQCKKECSVDKRLDYKTCNQEYKTCSNTCREMRKSCLGQARENKTQCRATCDAIEDRKEKAMCKRVCSQNYTQERKACSQESKECRNTCREEKSLTKKTIKQEYETCRAICSNESLPIFEEPTFNLLTNETLCVQSGGLFEKVCQGHLASNFCVTQKYCICQGTNNHTCPAEYTCELENGVLDSKRLFSKVGDWTDPRGRSLGDIGLCVKS